MTDPYDDPYGDEDMTLEESLSHEEMGVFTAEKLDEIIERAAQERRTADWVIVQNDLVPMALRTLHDGQISIRHRAASFIRLVLEKAVRVTPPELADDAEAMHLSVSNALCVLGYYHYNGTLGEHDYAKARECYERAEAMGNPVATLALGYFYQYGRGVETDYGKAFQYYNRANLSAPDLPEARYKVADMYFNGLGVERNERIAVRIYRQILEGLSDDDEWRMGEAQRTRESLYRRLAVAYRDGRGVDKDPGRALEYYEKLEVIHYRDLAAGRSDTPHYSTAAHLDDVQKEIAALRRQIDDEAW